MPRPVIGLRARMLLLVLLAVLPGAAFVVYSSVQSRARARGRVAERALSIARAISASEARFVEGTRQMLVTLAEWPEVRGADAEAAGRRLAALRKDLPRYLNLGVIELDGRVFASAVPLEGATHVADRGYFRDAVATGGFAAGSYQIGRITGLPSVNFGYPVRVDGAIVRVVFAALDLASIAQPDGIGAELPRGATLVRRDAGGRVIAAFPERPAGERAPEHALLERTGGRQAVLEMEDASGEPFLYAVVPATSAVGPDPFHVILGIPRDVAYATPRKILSIDLLGLGAILLFGIVAVWWGGRLLLRPVDRLQDAVGRIAAGDLAARAVSEHLPGKLGKLVDAFDAMAESLQQREAERDAAAARLREKDVLLRELAENIDEVFWVTEPKPKPFVYVSPAYERIWGRPVEELYESPAVWTEAIHPEDRARVVEAAERNEESGRYDETYRIVRPDGATRWVRDRAFPVRGTDGRILRIFGVVEDITELKRTDAALKEAEAHLLQTQKMEAIGNLAGGVAHDFNNLLGVILGNVEMLLEDMPKDDPERRKAEDIATAVERAAALTRQLLLFSRKQVLQPRALDLNAVLGNVHRLPHRVLESNIEMRVSLAPDLASIYADPVQVEQVLLNLAVNARDAMADGGRLVIETANADLEADHVRLHPDVVPGRYVVLSVSDTGCGMDAETRARIFEPFFTTKEPGKGTGLGLATVYGIVKQSGGHIWVYSEVGYGTTFRIRFPARDVPAAAGERAAGGAAPGGTETVLPVEDNFPLRKLARGFLEEAGYRVLEAPDAEAALAHVEATKEPVHLLLTDVVLPGRNGPDLARALARSRPSLRAVFISGYAGEVVSMLAPGAPFVPKPFTRRALLVQVRAALDAAPAWLPT
mgnify:CR=1 FL=1